MEFNFQLLFIGLWKPAPFYFFTGGSLVRKMAAAAVAVVVVVVALLLVNFNCIRLNERLYSEATVGRAFGTSTTPKKSIGLSV